MGRKKTFREILREAPRIGDQSGGQYRIGSILSLQQKIVYKGEGGVITVFPHPINFGSFCLAAILMVPETCLLCLYVFPCLGRLCFIYRKYVKRGGGQYFPLNMD